MVREENLDREYLLLERQGHIAQLRFLQEELSVTKAELAEARGNITPEQLQLEIDTLKEHLRQLQKMNFGDSSEKRPSPKPPKESTKPAQGHGRTEQPRLPHVDTVVELADDDRACESCGGTLTPIEGQSEDSEVIDVVTKRYLVRRIRRQKYRCECHCTIKTAPAPVKHIARGRYSLDFGAHVLCRKYAYHDPFDRQRRAMADEGLVVTTSTLWDQVDAIAAKLEPVYDALREHIVSADVIGVDETWWRLMDKKATKRWWVWAMQGGDSVYFKTAPSRSAATAAEVLGSFEGTAIADAYKAYETIRNSKKSKGEIFVLALCWAHVRRKFVEAEPDYPACSEAIDLIGQLYEIESDTLDPTLHEGEQKLFAERTRLQERGQRAPPILEKLKAWALTQRGLPRSSLRKAIDYMLGHWDALQVFVTDAYVPIDNNATERALRGVVLGRKNHFGSRSLRGTQVAAICYSLIESAKLAGLEPQAYITAAIHGIECGIAPKRLLPLRELWQ